MSIQSEVFNACYKHIVQRNGSPYILVATTFMETDELKPYANTDGSIILDLRMTSVQNLSVNEADISFSLRFRGQVVHTTVPYNAMFSIYDHKDPTVGMLIGIAFPQVPVKPESSPPPKVELPVRKKPHLTLVKN
jgi:stringent starvation protein B